MKTWKSGRAIYVHATLPLSLLSCGPPTSPKLILRKWHDALVCKMPCETASVYWCLIEKDNEGVGKGITRGEVVIKTIIKCLFPRGRILSVVVNFSAPSSPNSLTIPMGPYFLKWDGEELNLYILRMSIEIILTQINKLILRLYCF